MAQRIRAVNALIWIGVGIVVLVVWALAIVGAVCLWSGGTEDAALQPAPTTDAVARPAAPCQSTPGTGVA